jgi:hypothetical protein
MEEVKEEKKEVTTKSSNMAIYFVFVIVLLIVAGGAYMYGKHSVKPVVLSAKTSGQADFQSPPPSGLPNMKGQKFSDTSLYDQAVQIYPGTISESAKAILTGWNLKTTNLPNGSVQADLIPVGSEATEGDTMHSFTVKPGYKLYFVDLNPSDDKPGMDVNTHDDLGILVDGNGIIQ